MSVMVFSAWLRAMLFQAGSPPLRAAQKSSSRFIIVSVTIATCQGGSFQSQQSMTPTVGLKPLSCVRLLESWADRLPVQASAFGRQKGSLRCWSYVSQSRPGKKPWVQPVLLCCVLMSPGMVFQVPSVVALGYWVGCRLVAV